MTTVNEVVTAACRKIGVAGIETGVPAAYATAGLFALNAMMHGWKARGVDVSHTDVSLSDTFPLDDQYVEGTIYLLAERIGPEYQKPAFFDADDWFRSLQAAYQTVPTLTVPSALQRPPSREDREGNLPLVES